MNCCSSYLVVLAQLLVDPAQVVPDGDADLVVVGVVVGVALALEQGALEALQSLRSLALPVILFLNFYSIFD